MNMSHESAVSSVTRQECWHQRSPVEVGLDPWRRDPLDLPPAYSMVDMAHLPLQRRGVKEAGEE
jgi:hypothetical protein